MNSLLRNMVGGIAGGIAVSFMFAVLGLLFLPGWSTGGDWPRLALNIATVGAVMGGGLGAIGVFDDLASRGPREE